MKAYKSVIKAALADGYSVRIDQGEGDAHIHCAGYRDAVEAVEAVEESWILVVRPHNTKPGKWVLVGQLYCVLDFQGADDESICDWLCNRDDSIKNWADRWWDAYKVDNSYAGPEVTK